MDYKIFLKETKNNPEDWDICVATEFKNHAAQVREGIAKSARNHPGTSRTRRLGHYPVG
jgi:hypothetical protein